MITCRIFAAILASITGFGGSARAEEAQKIDGVQPGLNRGDGGKPFPVFRRETPVPLPRPPADPKGVSKPESQAQSLPERKPDRPAAAAPGACLASLRQMADADQAPRPAAAGGKCTIPQPVELKAIRTANGAVRLPPGTILDCRFARVLAGFTAEVAMPLARAQIGKTITELNTGPGFECRRRNRASDGKFSEHAFGNAIDITALSFEGGQRLDIRAADLMKEDEARLFRGLRKAACGYFTTVLGPGSNPAHATHLHFDLGRSAGRKNPYRICE